MIVDSRALLLDGGTLVSLAVLVGILLTVLAIGISYLTVRRIHMIAPLDPEDEEEEPA